MSHAFDPRRTPFREDLAAAHLRDKVRAPRYAEGEPRQVCAPSAALRSAPRFEAPLMTEALCGEIFTVYDIKDGWAWGQLVNDGYVGYMTADMLSTMIEETTHKVSSRATFVYPAPDFKKPPFMRLSFSAEVIVFAQEGKFAELSRGGYVYAGHLVPKQEQAKDYVRVAERFIGTPYLWGGKTSIGLDCSGLVQIALQAAGMNCPRDSDMQEAELGQPLPKLDIGALQRGDLIFWRGHVAIATSPDFLIHANAYHMETCIEPVRRAVERIAEQSGPVTSIRRIAPQETMAEARPLTTVPPDGKIAKLSHELRKAAASEPGKKAEEKKPPEAEKSRAEALIAKPAPQPVNR